MPRKPRPPLSLIIERLSDGKRGLVDEFTGEPIPEPNARPRATASERLDQRNRDRAKAKRELLESVGMLPSTKQVIYIPPGHMLVKVITDSNGKQFVITKPKPPFRRV